MPPKNKTRKRKKVVEKPEFPWTEEDMQRALHEFQSVPGSSKRGVARKHGLDESTFRKRLNKVQAGIPLKKPGRK